MVNGSHPGVACADRCGWAPELGSSPDSCKHERSSAAYPLVDGEYKRTGSTHTVGEHQRSCTPNALEIAL